MLDKVKKKKNFVPYPKGRDVDLNDVDSIKELIKEAVGLGAEFIALPECATSLHENSSMGSSFSYL